MASNQTPGLYYRNEQGLLISIDTVEFKALAWSTLTEILRVLKRASNNVSMAKSTCGVRLLHLAQTAKKSSDFSDLLLCRFGNFVVESHQNFLRELPLRIFLVIAYSCTISDLSKTNGLDVEEATKALGNISPVRYYNIVSRVREVLKSQPDELVNFECELGEAKILEGESEVQTAGKRAQKCRRIDEVLCPEPSANNDQPHEARDTQQHLQPPTNADGGDESMNLGKVILAERLGNLAGAQGAVIENASLQGIAKVFDEYMCGAIRRVIVHNELKAAVTTVLPLWGGPVACLISLDVCERDVVHLAMGVKQEMMGA